MGSAEYWSQKIWNNSTDLTGYAYVAVAEVDRGGNEGGKERQEEVPEPVGGGGEGHAFGTVARGEEFTANRPDHGTPGSREAEDEERCEADHSCAGGGGGLWIVAVEREVSDGREDHEADEHPGGPRDEGLAAAVVLDDVEAVECSPEVYSIQTALVSSGVLSGICRLFVSKSSNQQQDFTGAYYSHHLRDETVVDACGLEYDSPVVEEIICPGKLLEHLESDAEGDAVAHTRGGKHTIPFREHVAAGLFGLELGFDLLHFHVDCVVIWWGAVDFQHGLFRLILFSVPVVPSRGFWEENYADTEDRGPNEADTFGNSPGCGLAALMFVCAEVDATS